MPTLPSRRATFTPLFDKLCGQAKGGPVEVVALLDNRTRTIGAKCNALLGASRGVYVSFVDDDDAVSDDYVAEILAAIRPTFDLDVITFKIECRLTWKNGQTQEAMIWPDINDKNEEFHAGVVKRKPMQIACWRGALARSFKWADAQYEADTAWARQLWEEARSSRQHKIDRVLYWYRWSETGTEAK